MSKKIVVISGFNSGLSFSTALKFIEQGYFVIGLSRHHHTTIPAAKAEQFDFYPCDITNQADVSVVFEAIKNDHGDVSVLIHNASQLLLDDFQNIDTANFELIWQTICLGAFHLTQQVLPAMLEKGAGTLIYTGATASVKAGPKSAAFASAKFALRGLSQSLARAYGPQGIHVIHPILDGIISGKRAEQFQISSADCMDPDDIADSYLAMAMQNKSCWSHELDLRPFKENF